MFIRQYFHTYYELRRRFRGWKRQLFYHPNQTYEDILKKGTFVKFCAQLFTWNMVALFAIKRFFREEITSLHDKGIEKPKLTELWNERSGRIEKDDDSNKYTFKSPLHSLFDFSTPTKRENVDLTKIKYPLDDI
ncbi:hypothetical protein ACQ4LE_003332 [Meloidogyne hapla]|uniref:Uncharacterized protein n=1 Tax=Meloidogyne hapla TaxID=6305 RepID=A0A1I8BBQ6_MELHA